MFILAGQALADGHLPYTLVWEIKPPLALSFYAVPLLLVPNSLAFIRLLGAVLVGVTGFLVFRLSRRLMPRREAILAGLLTVMAMSLLIPSGRAVVTEHLAMVPLLLAVLLLASDRRTAGALLFAGALLGIAVFVRTNLALVALAVALALLFCPGKQSRLQRCQQSALVVAGGLAVALLSYVPYALTGRSDLFVRSVFLAPLGYAAGGPGLLAVAGALAERALALELSPKTIPRLLLWLGGLAGLAILAHRQRRRPERVGLWVLLFSAAAYLSILLSGRGWGHYLLQIAPFFALGVGLIAASVPRRLSPWLAGAIAASLVLAMPPPSSYARLAERWGAGESLYEGEYFAVAHYLQSVSQPTDSLFVTDDILLYWLTHRYPLVPVAAFPGNLWAEKSILQPLYGPGATTAAMLQQVLCHAPTWIVIRTSQQHEGLAGFEPLRTALAEDYRLHAEVAGRRVFRREDSSLAPPCPFPA